MSNAEAFWNKVAFKYSRKPIKNIRAYKQTMQRTLSYLSGQDKVLEIGCGTGSTALLLADCVGTITASDVSATMIAIGLEKAADHDVENVEFRQATPFDSCFDEEVFDAVLAFNMLHLLDDVPAAAARINSRLKPGGLFISKTPCLAGKAWLFKPLVAVMRLFRLAPPVTFLSIPQLERYLKDAGFEIVETGDYPASPPNHFIVARKPGD